MNQRTRIKICGVSQEADIAAAVDAGADAIGLVFHPASPRFVAPERAAQLARILPPYVTPVGLFVNASRADIDRVLALIPALVLQVHGDESPDACNAFARPYLRAARMAPGFDLLDFSRRYSEAQGLLLDAHVEGFGGGGRHSIGRSFLPASRIRSFCLVDCVPKTSLPASSSCGLGPLT